MVQQQQKSKTSNVLNVFDLEAKQIKAPKGKRIFWGNFTQILRYFSAMPFHYFSALFFLLLLACSPQDQPLENQATFTVPESDIPTPELTLAQANILAELPLACIEQQYPNKLGQTLNSAAELAEPSALHPAFYGCFDWHSAVHGHWSLVALLKDFPQLEKADTIRALLAGRITAENIAAEVAYFNGPQNKSFERTYGWAWLLKLAEELHTWENDSLARQLETNLQPLTDLVIERYLEFLPKLVYPVRTGEHPNTGFGLAFAWDYANTVNHKPLKKLIEQRARDFFIHDRSASFAYEPSGYDFLSPVLQEVDIMRRVLPANEFHAWLAGFLPALTTPDFKLAVGEVGDRTDGKLVHLDGLNFSRAWVFYGLARQYPRYAYLRIPAHLHVNYSLPQLVGDSYEGGHWLGSFAIYALRG